MAIAPQFRCSDDVEKYFAFVRALVRSTEPPSDLWETMERTRRGLLRKSSMSRRLEPAPHSLEFHVFTSPKPRKIRPARTLQRVTLIRPTRRTKLVIPKIRPTPLSLGELLKSKRERK